MGHKLFPILVEHSFGEDAKQQCVKCGCTFQEEVTNEHADFFLSCKLERSLRQSDHDLVEKRPIVVCEYCDDEPYMCPLHGSDPMLDDDYED